MVELLVSTGVLSILLLVTMSALETMQRSWRDTKGKVNQFREARVAFETITRNLSQATLNTYWDYYYSETSSNVPPSDASGAPKGYVRQSELDFRVVYAHELASSNGSKAEYPGHSLFFQAPLGLSQQYRGLGSLLNARGYYVRFTSNEDQRPAFLQDGVVPVRHHYQLMEYRPPAEQAKSLQGNTVYTNANWFKQNLEAVSRPIANNILLFIVSPQVPKESLTGASGSVATRNTPTWIAPLYRYSSRDVNNRSPALDNPTLNPDGTLNQQSQHLLPPLVRVTLIAGEEGTMSRWLESNGNEPVDLSTIAPFTDAEDYDDDLATIKEYLTAQRLNFRVFTATVPLRNAAWDSTTY